MKYLHNSMLGSFYVTCTIEDVRPWKEEYMTTIERDFGMAIPPHYQYLIRFFDENIVEEVDKWVNDYYVEEEWAEI